MRQRERRRAHSCTDTLVYAEHRSVCVPTKPLPALAFWRPCRPQYPVAQVQLRGEPSLLKKQVPLRDFVEKLPRKRDRKQREFCDDIPLRYDAKTQRRSN